MITERLEVFNTTVGGTMKLLSLALILMWATVAPAFAQLTEEEPDYSNNTGATGASSSTSVVDVNTENTQEVTGTKEGEITIYKTDSGVEVYSGLNKVESIPEGSDGWVGQIQESSSMINFTPAGRPKLDCPAQDIANWYGPCKLPEVANS